MQKKFPSLKKYSKLDGFHRDIDHGRVKSRVVYINPGATEFEEIPKKDIVKGFNYGQKIITVQDELLKEMKI